MPHVSFVNSRVKNLNILLQNMKELLHFQVDNKLCVDMGVL